MYTLTEMQQNFLMTLIYICAVCSEEAVFVRATKEHSVKCFESPSSDNVVSFS